VVGLGLLGLAVVLPPAAASGLAPWLLPLVDEGLATALLSEDVAWLGLAAVAAEDLAVVVLGRSVVAAIDWLL
jgi:hypothetical protein